MEIGERNQQTSNSASQNTANNQPRKNTPGRRKKPCLSSRERNVRRIESNERERLRMHGLNIAFQVLTEFFNIPSKLLVYNSIIYKCNINHTMELHNNINITS